MFEQAYLPGLAPKPGLNLLFFGLMPNASEACRILRLREQLLRDCGLTRGQLLTADRLHVSLHGIGKYESPVPGSVVRQAEQAGSLISMQPFEISFDGALSFDLKQGKHAFVLRAAPSAPLIACHRVVGDAMKRVGFRHVRSTFTPHLTLLYEHHFVVERRVETVTMNAQSLVLIQSLQGRGKYIHLARWLLRGEGSLSYRPADLE